MKITIPKPTTMLRSWRWGLVALPLIALAVLVTVLAWGHSATQTTQADNTNPGNIMSLEIRDPQGGLVCDSNTQPSTPTQGEKCQLLKDGTVYTLSVNFKSIPVGGYVSFATMIEATGGNLDYLGLPQVYWEIKWPDTLIDMGFRDPVSPNKPNPDRWNIPWTAGHNALSFSTSTFKGAAVNLDVQCKEDAVPKKETWLKLVTLDENPMNGAHYRAWDSSYVSAAPAKLGVTCEIPTPTSTSTATPTATATPTPKPEGTGNLSGVYYLRVHDFDKAVQYANCRVRLDHDAVTNQVKTASTCYNDQPGLDYPDSKVPDPNIDQAGPPPPPPYGAAGPAKGNGSYDKGSDSITWFTCFQSVGGVRAPNVIWVVTISYAKATLPQQSGVVYIWYGQGIDECNAKTPNGGWTLSLPVNFTLVDTQPYDNTWSVDSDGDGCPDAFELDKNRPKKLCGDDPWNPHDSDLIFDSTVTILMEVIRADVCMQNATDPSGGPPLGCDGASQKDIAAGFYFDCQAVLDHDEGETNDITGQAFCYVDIPVITVNIEDNGGHVGCAPFGTGTADMCGDGLPGAAPPGPMADNDGTAGNAQITGRLDKVNNKVILDMCLEQENPLVGPYAYFRIEVDAHTGIGTVDIWYNRLDCVKPLGPPDTDDAHIEMAEQDDDYDPDQDRCTTAEELHVDANRSEGGARDPYNKKDHTDVNKDGGVNIPDDILGVAANFGAVPPGDPQADIGSRMIGSVSWAHRNGDGYVNIPDDILGTAAQFGHNCDGNPG